MRKEVDLEGQPEKWGRTKKKNRPDKKWGRVKKGYRPEK